MSKSTPTKHDGRAVLFLLAELLVSHHHQNLLSYTSGWKRPSVLSKVQTSQNATRWDLSNIRGPEWMNENALILSALKTDREQASSSTPCEQIQPLSRIKKLNGPRRRVISPAGEERSKVERIYQRVQNERLIE